MDGNVVKVKRFKLSLIELDGDEQIICEIRKHPIGAVVILITGLFISLVILFAGIFGSLWLEDNGSSIGTGSSYAWVVTLAAIVLSVFCLILMAVSIFIYRSNVVLITSEKIAQVLYKTIFDRKVSQLNIADVQDVTVSQVGVLARVFNYGTLVIETAGEQQNYTFTFAPEPHACSKIIIGAHEKNVAKFGN